MLQEERGQGQGGRGDVVSLEVSDGSLGVGADQGPLLLLAGHHTVGLVYCVLTY